MTNFNSNGRDAAGRNRATRRDATGRIRNMWTEDEKAEASGIDLAAPSRHWDNTHFGPVERLQRLAEEGYAPAIAVRSKTDARSRAGIEESWKQSFAIAGYDSERPVPKMPDNATVKHLSGNSIDGERRTYRRKYEVDGWTFRPQGNVTAIKRVMAENDWKTMDITVDTQDPQGRNVKLEVRVTKGVDNTWAVTPVGVDGQNPRMVAAGVQAFLESRRPTHVPNVVGGLAERARRQMSSEGVVIEPRNVTSTWIDSVEYNDADGMMITRTQDGKVYGHTVPRAVFEKIRHDEKPGKVYNQLIRAKGSQAAQASVATCGRCQAVFAMANEHRCRIEHHTPKAPKNKSKMQNNRWMQRVAGLGGLRKSQEV